MPEGLGSSKVTVVGSPARVVTARTTWDGLPIAPDPPYAAAVAVWRWGAAGVEWLLLHRKPEHRDPDDVPGEWEWGCPGGARLPGEPVDLCARRELEEETGLRLHLRSGVADPICPLFLAEAPRDTPVELSDEHDAYRWVRLEAAALLIRPEGVAAQFERAARTVEGPHRPDR